MKNNKLISVLLALLVCLSMVVSASATTESDLSFTLETSSSVEVLGAAVVNAGDTFTVNVNIAANPGVLAAITYVEFDSAVLELVSAKSVACFRLKAINLTSQYCKLRCFVLKHSLSKVQQNLLLLQCQF